MGDEKALLVAAFKFVPESAFCRARYFASVVCLILVERLKY